jgi:hypothetical protein
VIPARLHTRLLVLHSDSIAFPLLCAPSSSILEKKFPRPILDAAGPFLIFSE